MEGGCEDTVIYENAFLLKIILTAAKNGRIFSEFKLRGRERKREGGRERETYVEYLSSLSLHTWFST